MFKCAKCGNDATVSQRLANHIMVDHLQTGMTRMVARMTSCVGGDGQAILVTPTDSCSVLHLIDRPGVFNNQPCD